MRRHHYGRTIALLLAGLIAALGLFLRTDWAGRRACRLARDELSRRLGLEVDLGRCRLDPIRGGMEIAGVRLALPGAGEPLLAADRVRVRLRPDELMVGTLHLERVEIDRPRVHLDLERLSRQSPSPAPPEGPQTPACPLRMLERVRIDSLAITDADVQARAERQAFHLHGLDLDLRLSSGAYQMRLAVAGGEAELAGVRKPVSRLRVATSLNLDRRELELHNWELVAGDLAISANGRIEDVCAPRGRAELSVNVPLDLLAAVAPEALPPLSGVAAANLRVEGTLAQPSAEVELSLIAARIGPYEVGDAYLDARLDRTEARILRLDIPFPGGSLRARGSIGLEGELPVSAEVDLERVPFGPLLDRLDVDHSWVHFSGSGAVEVRGTLSPFRLSGPASIEVRDFRLFDRGFDQAPGAPLLQFDMAQVDFQASFDAERARLGSARIRSRRSELAADASLYYESNRGLDIEAQVRHLDLDDLGHLMQIPWAGQVQGQARIRGPYSDPVIAGRAAIERFRFHALALGSVEGSLEYRDDRLRFSDVGVLYGRSRFQVQGELDFTGPSTVGRGRCALENGRLSELVEMVGDEYWIFDWLRGRMEAQISGQATVDGPLSQPRSLISLALSEATYAGRRLGRGDFIFRSQNGDQVFIDQLEFDGPFGHASLAGRVDIGRGIELRIEAPVLQAKELALPDLPFLKAQGTFAIQARLFGPPETPRMEGTVAARDIALLGLALGDGDLALALDHSRLSLKGPVGPDLLVDARLVLQDGYPFAVGLSASTTELGRYLPQVAGLRGALEGELIASGSAEDLSKTRGELWVGKLQAGVRDYEIENDGPLRASFEGAAVSVRSLVLRGPTRTWLTVAGEKSAAGALDLAIDGEVDARVVEAFTDWVEQTGGRLRVSAALTGPVQSPSLVGDVRIASGRFHVRDLPAAVGLRDLEGRLQFSQNRIDLGELTGTLNGGRATIRGEISMHDFRPTHLDLSLAFEEAHVRYPETVPSTFTGEVRLQGPPDALLLSGEVDLVRLRYAEDVDTDNLLREARRRRIEVRAFERRGELLRYDVTVHVLGDARIDNNLLDLALEGDLKIVGTNAHMGMVGSLTAVEGGRAFFRGNEIALTRVTVDLMERDRIAPVIDVQGETSVRDYRVFVRAHGALEDPQVDLTSDPPLARADIVTLLTLGLISVDNPTVTAALAGTGLYSAGAGAGLVGETLFNISGLDKQVRRFFPRNSVLRDFNVQISTQYSEVSAMVEPTAQIESKVLTDAFRVRLSQPVITGRGRRAQMEYRISQTMSAQAQWDNESSENHSLGDLGLDLKLRWDLD